MRFSFDQYVTNVKICKKIPCINNIFSELGAGSKSNTLIIADENTSSIAAKVSGDTELPLCLLTSGEENKNWQSVEKILLSAHKAGIDRDGVFIAVGGGVVSDLAGFAASIYMRGCRLVLISTTLLGMVDASVGGKTGFDLFGVKNLSGSFYPAEIVYMPLDTLCSLPQREWKSGMAELIKTAVLAGDDFLEQLITVIPADVNKLPDCNLFEQCIEKAVLFKGSIVTEDPRESGKRMLLNLGHTFGHALESAAGLGNISHGEAVAWGIVRACELGIALNITPEERARKIKDLIESSGYECKNPHPLAENKKVLCGAMQNDKKKKYGKLTFIVPDAASARTVTMETDNEKKILQNILQGGNNIS